MDNILPLILAMYFLGGLLALGVLELLTRRVSSRLRPSARETQSRLISTGNYVGNRSSVVLLLVVLWLLWPVAIYGALTTAVGKGSKENKDE